MPYNGQYTTIPGLKANSTGLASSQYLFGKLASTAGQVVLAGVLNSTTVATPCVMGVIMNAPAGGEEVPVGVRWKSHEGLVVEGQKFLRLVAQRTRRGRQ